VLTSFVIINCKNLMKRLVYLRAIHIIICFFLPSRRERTAIYIFYLKFSYYKKVIMLLLIVNFFFFLPRMRTEIYISILFNDYCIMKVHIYLPIFYILGNLYWFINNI
jgi:hypothetical protein